MTPQARMDAGPPRRVRVRDRHRHPARGEDRGFGRRHRDADARGTGQLAGPRCPRGFRVRLRPRRHRALPKPAHDHVDESRQQKQGEDEDLFHARYRVAGGGVASSPGCAIDCRIAVSACTFLIL